MSAQTASEISGGSCWRCGAAVPDAQAHFGRCGDCAHWIRRRWAAQDALKLIRTGDHLEAVNTMIRAVNRQATREGLPEHVRIDTITRLHLHHVATEPQFEQRSVVVDVGFMPPGSWFFDQFRFLGGRRG